MIFINMEWFIKKNATLPIIKINISQDGRSDYQNNIQTLLESNVYFSMVDVDTNLIKISSVPSTVTTGLTDNGEIEYFVQYQFKKNQTKKTGRFKAEITIKNSDGVVGLPLNESLYINIIDSFAIDDVNFSSNYEIEFPCCD